MKFKIKNYQIVKNKNQYNLIILTENNEVFEFENIKNLNFDPSNQLSNDINKDAVNITLNFNKIFYEK